jgi:hypothetical protein
MAAAPWAPTTRSRSRPLATSIRVGMLAVVVATHPTAPKFAALRARPRVALTIDTPNPPRSLAGPHPDQGGPHAYQAPCLPNLERGRPSLGQPVRTIARASSRPRPRQRERSPAGGRYRQAPARSFQDRGRRPGGALPVDLKRTGAPSLSSRNTIGRQLAWSGGVPRAPKRYRANEAARIAADGYP